MEETKKCSRPGCERTRREIVPRVNTDPRTLELCARCNKSLKVQLSNNMPCRWWERMHGLAPAPKPVRTYRPNLHALRNAVKAIDYYGGVEQLREAPNAMENALG